MAVFMNAKGTQSAAFQFGKRGSKVFGSTVTPTASEVTTGDLWFDISNNETKLASKSGDTVTWNKIITENFGDLTVTGNLTVEGTTTTVDSTTVNVQNAFVFEGATADAHETTLTTVDPTADRTIRLPNASGTLAIDGAIEVEDLAATAYVTTSETWNDNDSELATTGRISAFIDTEIANATTIMHTTGAESMAGVKTFTNGVTIPSGGTLTLTDATITGANTDSISEGSTNLYYTNPRARTAISVTDNSSAGNELSYNSSTGVISWNGTTAGSPGGSNTQIQFNDSGAFGGHANLTFDSSSETFSVSNLNVTNFTYQILSEDYGNVGETTIVTQDFGNITAEARTEYMTNLTDDETPQLAGNLDAQNNNIDNIGVATAKSYKDTVYTITDGASVDIDPDNGGIQVWTLGANRTPTANSFDAGAKVMLMINDGSGYTITWPSVNWVGGVAPTLATSGYSIIELWKVGSQLYGAFAGGVA